MKPLQSVVTLALGSLLLLGSTALTGAEGPRQESSYAVVVRKDTLSRPAWHEVVAVLEKKHQAKRHVYEKDVAEVLTALQKHFPRYICFVARPEEAGRPFVTAAHLLTRQLDDDPYPDAIWSVLTGYEPEDAVRIARHATPLMVKQVLTATVGSPLDAYETGKMYNELKSNEMWVKTADGAVVKEACPTDITKPVADDLNRYGADAFITSGHATERDWNPGYGFRCGKFRCEDGVLYGMDLAGTRYDIHSPNPKVHLAIGNCLIGHIPDRNCMALALMHSAGVYQMLGYTVPTWYGYGGWGVKDYFSELQAGRFTLAEANYVNNLALVYELEKSGGESRGLAYDRDVVVLYGDPAWPARMPERTLPWSQELSEHDGLYTFRIVANETGDWDNRPVIELLPHRIRNIHIIKGDHYKPVIMDNFILVPVHQGLEPMKGNRGERFPITGDFKKGDVIEIRFKADRGE